MQMLKEDVMYQTAWRIPLVFIMLCVLLSCGLEPRYVSIPKAPDDGKAIWLNHGIPVPASYSPLQIGDPAIGICRALVTAPAGLEKGSLGYVIGEMTDKDICNIPEGGRIFTFHTGFEQLYLRNGTYYQWIRHQSSFLAGDATESILWAKNAVPIEPMRRTGGSYVFVWLPCATYFDGSWHIGKYDVTERTASGTCNATGSDREVGVYNDYYILYIPREP